MAEAECLFCRIARGDAPVKIIWQNDDYFAIKDKYPKAPIHLLVIPKDHVSKNEKMRGSDQSHWGPLMAAVFEVVRLKKLTETGYKVVSYGAGYNHFDHEHVHVMGGGSKQPVE
jgi:histidine triad (HIT) family protein